MEKKKCKRIGRFSQGNESHPAPDSIHTVRKHKGRRGRPSYLVVILTRHVVGERDLRLEHLPALCELNQQVAHGLEFHPLGCLDVGQDEPWEYLCREVVWGRPVSSPELPPGPGTTSRGHRRQTGERDRRAGSTAHGSRLLPGPLDPERGPGAGPAAVGGLGPGQGGTRRPGRRWLAGWQPAEDQRQRPPGSCPAGPTCLGDCCCAGVLGDPSPGPPPGPRGLPLLQE